MAGWREEHITQKGGGGKDCNFRGCKWNEEDNATGVAHLRQDRTHKLLI